MEAPCFTACESTPSQFPLYLIRRADVVGYLLLRYLEVNMSCFQTVGLHAVILSMGNYFSHRNFRIGGNLLKYF